MTEAEVFEFELVFALPEGGWEAEGLSDALFEAGFDDALIGLGAPGLVGLARSLARELGSRSITVNVVAPGPVETRLFLDGKSDEQVRAITAMNPFKRLGRPEDIAAVVTFLAGPDGAWVSGQVIRANGGVV